MWCSFNKLIRKIRLSIASVQILDSRIILTIDMATSVIASFLVALMFRYFAGVQNLYYLKVLLSSCLGSMVGFSLFHTYRIIIRHSRLSDLTKIMFAVLLKVFVVLALWAVMIPDISFSSIQRVILLIPVGILEFFVTFSALVMVRMFMTAVYEDVSSSSMPSREKLMIYGTGRFSASLLSFLLRSRRYEVAGFLNFDSKNLSQSVYNYDVYSFDSIEDIEAIYRKQHFSYIIFPKLEDLHHEENRLVVFCHEHGIKILISPNIDNVEAGGDELKLGIREIQIEDILGRDEININMKDVRRSFIGKVVMVTGAAGSIGSELCRQMANLGVSSIILFDNAETPLHNIRLELDEKWGKDAPDGERVKIVPIIGNVHNLARLEFVFRRYHPDVVFHAAAYKHVPLIEENPCEAVKTNVTGTRNVADCCVKYGAQNMIMISTDKAVNPTNVMGATKRAAEMYVQGLSRKIASGEIDGVTRFTTTRFGNVLGSNGSVVPRFRKQLETGGPLTVTSTEITRFFMSIPEACRLVTEAATLGEGGDIFVFDMGEPVKIIDLARNMIRLAGYVPEKDIKIEITGLRPGEKLYEEVLALEENTVSTNNPKIRKAKIRDVDFDNVVTLCDSLEVQTATMSTNKNCQMDTVGLLKKLVPEFKSQNSVYEQLD